VVEHWSEKPGVDSSILSPATIFTAEQKSESRKQRESNESSDDARCSSFLEHYLGGGFLKSKLTSILVFVSACSLALNVYLFISRRRAFWSGNNAGIVQKCEGEIVASYLGLDALEKVKDPAVEEYKKMLVMQLNTALSAVLFSEKEVKMRPLEWKILIQMSSPIYKEFYRKLGVARIAHGWQSPEPAVEKRIQKVIDQYAKDGNLYGILR
jgi:hypothetical protein